MNAVEFLVREAYPPLANHPMFLSRKREFGAAASFAQAYGFTLTEIDFDDAIAKRFGDGCEYEWSAE